MWLRVSTERHGQRTRLEDDLGSELDISGIARRGNAGRAAEQRAYSKLSSFTDPIEGSKLEGSGRRGRRRSGRGHGEEGREGEERGWERLRSVSRGRSLRGYAQHCQMLGMMTAARTNEQPAREVEKEDPSWDGEEEGAKMDVTSEGGG